MKTKLQFKKDKRYFLYTLLCGVNQMNWLSIKRTKDCLFSRRNGYSGKIILGYSIRLRLFNHDLI